MILLLSSHDLSQAIVDFARYRMEVPLEGIDSVDFRADLNEGGDRMHLSVELVHLKDATPAELAYQSAAPLSPKKTAVIPHQPIASRPAWEKPKA